MSSESVAAPPARTAYPVHALALTFPHDPQALTAITESIRDHGQNEPVVLLDGQILDGVHRAGACQALGIEVKTTVFTGTDPLQFVIDQNLNRRQLTEGQRAMIASKLATMRQGERTDRNLVGAPIKSEPPLSQSTAAAKLRVSRASVSMATTIRRHAAPAVVKEVEQGRRSLKSATATIQTATISKPVTAAKPVKPVTSAVRKDMHRSPAMALEVAQRATAPLREMAETLVQQAKAFAETAAEIDWDLTRQIVTSLHEVERLIRVIIATLEAPAPVSSMRSSKPTPAAAGASTPEPIEFEGEEDEADYTADESPAIPKPENPGHKVRKYLAWECDSPDCDLLALEDLLDPPPVEQLECSSEQCGETYYPEPDEGRACPSCDRTFSRGTGTYRCPACECEDTVDSFMLYDCGGAECPQWHRTLAHARACGRRSRLK